LIDERVIIGRSLARSPRTWIGEEARRESAGPRDRRGEASSGYYVRLSTAMGTSTSCEGLGAADVALVRGQEQRRRAAVCYDSRRGGITTTRRISRSITEPPGAAHRGRTRLGAANTQPKARFADGATSDGRRGQAGSAGSTPGDAGGLSVPDLFLPPHEADRAHRTRFHRMGALTGELTDIRDLTAAQGIRSCPWKTFRRATSGRPGLHRFTVGYGFSGGRGRTAHTA